MTSDFSSTVAPDYRRTVSLATMKNRTIVGLLAVACLWGATANAQPAAACDRECLRSKVTQLLYALVKHDVSGLPVASTLRVTWLSLSISGRGVPAGMKSAYHVL